VPKKAPALHGAVVVPAMIADAGDRAARRFLEFFAANSRNKNTPMAITGLLTGLRARSLAGLSKTGSAT
jgi:hypothetical protein